MELIPVPNSDFLQRITEISNERKNDVPHNLSFVEVRAKSYACKLLS